MILYRYECENCSVTSEQWSPMEERNQQLCSTCGLQLKLLICPVTIDPDLGWKDPDSFPTLADKWANRKTKEHVDANRKADKEGRPETVIQKITPSDE